MDGNVCLNSNESIIATNTTGSSGDLDNWTITNNVFAEGPLGNSPGGQTNAHIWCVDQDGQGSHFFIYFNTCDSGLFVSRASWRLSGATGSSQQLFNNIITNSGFQPYSAGSGSFDCPGGGCTVTADYNLLYDSSDSYSGWPSHTIVNQNPLYLNKAAHNYNIQVGSPAIDAALNENVLVDLIGHARPNGSGYDIGAYELASGTAANVNPPTNLSYTVH